MSHLRQVSELMGYLGKLGSPIEEKYVFSSRPIKLLLFSQHGMTDNNRAMGLLARKLAPPQSCIIAPNLGLIDTHLNIEPLICYVERTAAQILEQYRDLPARIIASSLGGVIWIEVLSVHPEWWQRFESLVLLGSPLGGADLARIIDPFSWGIGMAKHLGKNRRAIAEQITAAIPTLVVAGNITGGGDGTVSIESTKLKHAHFVCLEGVTHPELRTHPAVIKAIQEFWSSPRQVLPAPKKDSVSILIEYFRDVPGITDASARDFPAAKTIMSFPDGTSIRTWTNLVGVKHVFIANKYGECEYAAFVGWIHSAYLQKAIDALISLS
ncbi:alpha/beta fold hydrolase [Myxosarcina sp. GI1]|uniref:alpha/beta fold hydrolase n=1 Tax=Myxosarcina sp. GI1 TaxID=1541065 RepID=UPI001C126193|nr:alpha/beta hydrolase [Myxosarcina sp. GI1]